MLTITTKKTIPWLMITYTLLTHTNLQAAGCTLTTPNIVVPAWLAGDPLDTGSNYAQSPTVFQLPADNSAAPTTLLTAVEVGSIWGVAHDQPNGKIYFSSVLRRHSGLGPAGSATCLPLFLNQTKLA